MFLFGFRNITPIPKTLVLLPRNLEYFYVELSPTRRKEVNYNCHQHFKSLLLPHELLNVKEPNFRPKCMEFLQFITKLWN